MTRPPTDALTLARELLRLGETHLATCDGDQPRVRPMSVALVEGATIWLASFAHWGKVRELAANPRAELSFLEPSGKHLRLTGQARVLDDPAARRRIWQQCELVRRYFPAVDDPRYRLIEFRSERVRVKDAWELEYRELDPAALVASDPVR